MSKRVLLHSLILILLPVAIYADVTDYLLLQNIGPYQLFTGISGRVFSGSPSKYSRTDTGGILDAASHFTQNDTSYEASYTESSSKWPFIKVEVTQHAGGDSDKWLLHEAEKAFRDSDKLEASSDEDSMIREIEGNKIYFYGGGVVGYRWLNGNVIINIQYNNLSGPKAEPLEVVKAYLAKFPSSIVMSDSDFKSKAHDDQWIKEEMERRLWLCDKWFEQLGLQKTEQKTALFESVKSMNVFLDYREKYYGLKADDEKGLLAGYLEANNEVGIKTKLQEYKDWWAANKSGSFFGVLSVYTHKAYNQISLFFRKIFMFFGSLIKMVFG